jgi:hypothetical protein
MVRKVEGQTVLFESMGLNFGVPLLATLLTGTIGAIAAIYALYEWWITREHHRLTRLHNYAVAEEYDLMGDLGDREYDKP